MNRTWRSSTVRIMDEVRTPFNRGVAHTSRLDIYFQAVAEGYATRLDSGQKTNIQLSYRLIRFKDCFLALIVLTPTAQKTLTATTEEFMIFFLSRSSNTRNNEMVNRVSGRTRVWRLMCFAMCLSLALLLSCARTHAQDPKCAFNASNISFGTVDLQKGNPYDAAGTFSYACTGDRREILRICPSFGLGNDGTRWMTDSAGDKLLYNLYTDEDRNTVWGTWYSKDIKGPSIDVPLGRSEKTTGSVPIYGRITANQQNAHGGAYKATINGGNVAISYGYASKGSCESFKHGDRVSVGFTITANVRGGENGPGAITAPDATKPQASSSPQVTPGQPEEKKSVLQKLMENAEYQRQQQNRAGGGASDNQDSDTSPTKQEDRAKYIETHSCMTTAGADKANELA